MKHLLLCFLILSAISPARAVEYFVALNGDDKNDGSIEKPFQHIQYAADKMQPGDITIIRGGHYFEKINIQGYKGTEKKPFIFKAFKNEKVVLNGTVAIKSAWKKYSGNIYQTQLSSPIWQLFVNNKSMTSARWPNGNWYDGSIWDKKNSMMWPEKGELGNYYNNALTALNFDLTDGIIVVNSGSFKTYQTNITQHNAGEDNFSFNTKGVKSHFSFKEGVKRHGYFLEGKLGLLDEENEWFYDVKTKKLYLWAARGINPETLDVRGKVQSYALTIDRSSDIQLQGINFFATTFNIKGSQYIKIADVELNYPSYSKRMLGDLSKIDVTKMLVNKGQNKAKNHLLNCKITYTDGPALEMNGSGNVVENCLMSDIDYSCTYKGGFALNMVNAADLIFRRNTVKTTGCSELFKAGVRNRIELNDLSDSGHLQNDGSMIQVSVKQQPNSIVRYNWVHDSVKQGIRFDNKNTPNAPYGEHGNVFNNVAWNTDRIYFKGDNHYIFNNVSFDNHQNDLIISSNKDIQGHNHGTLTRNNISNKFSGHRSKPGKKYPVPGVVNNNWDGNALGLDVRSQLRDPDNLDFRPKANSQLIDAGLPIKNKTSYFLGKAPDIGAYEFGASDYWIPGFQSNKTSQPIPPIAATKVKHNADLMWLNAYQASSHFVYFGANKNDVLLATKSSTQYQGEYQHNIFTPKLLAPGKTYYWRVDAIKNDQMIKGDVWEFTVED